MKLDLLEPNAHYDMVHGKPKVIEFDNDGSWIFRLNIREEKEDEKQTGWQCYEVRGYNKATKRNVKRVIIRSVIDETQEFDLVNSYNKCVLGIVTDKSAIDKYKEYLQFTEDLEAVLEKDLSN